MPLSEYKRTPCRHLFQRVRWGTAVLLFATHWCASAWAEANKETDTATKRATANSHQEWMCKAGPDGEWQCAAISAPGPAYQHPPRRVTARSAKPPPADEPRVKVARNLDWVPEEALSEEQRAEQAIGCCGTYVEPPRDYPDAQSQPKASSLRVSADSTEAQGDVATMRGDVQISQGYRQVNSDLAIVDQSERTVELKGGLQFREPGLLVLGERAKVNLDTQALEVDNAVFVMHEADRKSTRLNSSHLA